MSPYDSKGTPDYSPLLAHFTKSRPMAMESKITAGHPLHQHKSAGALERLLSILNSRTIFAGPMPSIPNNPEAVCFTEGVWDALVLHAASHYSPYGIVFSKRIIHQKGGGPALYMRGDSLQTLGSDLPDVLKPMTVPFDPDGVLTPGVPIDTLTEREWRLPKSLEFEYEQIEYVIVDSIQDATRVVTEIGPQFVPHEKVIPMDVYNTIRNAWE